MTTALEVRNINKKYKNKVILNDINFSIQSGEIVALIYHPSLYYIFNINKIS